MRRAPASSKALSNGLWRQLLLAAMVGVCLPLSAWAQVCGTPGKDGPARRVAVNSPRLAAVAVGVWLPVLFTGEQTLVDRRIFDTKGTKDARRAR